MILKIRHKGLRLYFESGNLRGLNPDWVPRIGRILAILDAASEPDGMDIPGLGLHPLKGSYAGYWAVRVTGNWRIVWRFEGTHATDVDLVDYH